MPPAFFVCSIARGGKTENTFCFFGRAYSLFCKKSPFFTPPRGRQERPSKSSHPSSGLFFPHPHRRRRRPVFSFSKNEQKKARTIRRGQKGKTKIQFFCKRSKGKAQRTVNRPQSASTSAKPPYFSAMCLMLRMPNPWFCLSALCVTGMPSLSNGSSPSK